MKPPGWTYTIGIVAFFAFTANYIVRVAGPGDTRSTGLVIDLFFTYGPLPIAIGFLGAVIILKASFWIYGFLRGIMTPGVFNFWQIVAQNPDDAYDFFLNSDIWEVRDYPLGADAKTEFPCDLWAGPFNLYVPKIHKRVCIFGDDKRYMHSQEAFVKAFKSKSL